MEVSDTKMHGMMSEVYNHAELKGMRSGGMGTVALIHQIVKKQGAVKTLHEMEQALKGHPRLDEADMTKDLDVVWQQCLDNVKKLTAKVIEERAKEVIPSGEVQKKG